MGSTQHGLVALRALVAQHGLDAGGVGRVRVRALALGALVDALALHLLRMRALGLSMRALGPGMHAPSDSWPDSCACVVEQRALHSALHSALNELAGEGGPAANSLLRGSGREHRRRTLHKP